MSDPRSSILVIPATSSRSGSEQARRIVELVIAEENEDGREQQSTRASTSYDSSSPSLIPWYISNRYYDAEVCFRIADEAVSQHVGGKRRAVPQSTRERRKAKLRSDDDGRAGEDSAVLDAQVRNQMASLNVFDVLSQPATNRTEQSERSHDRSQLNDSIERQLKQVDAVLILVDSNQSLADHKRLLSAVQTLPTHGTGSTESESGDPHALSGFDLAISLVVALPASSSDAAAPPDAPLFEHDDSVEDLYAEQGWEYIDLAKADRYSDEDEEPQDDGPEPLEREESGIGRVREALMTHTWPGLKRKNDRGRAAIEDDQTKTLASLQFNLDALDRSASGQEPSEKDEQLAREFLARIESSQLARLAEEEGARGSSTQRSNADMQLALEKFLEDQDEQWPQATASTNGHGRAEMQPGSNADQEAWLHEGGATVRAGRSSSNNQSGFEDDFADFVQAETPSNRAGHGIFEQIIDGTEQAELQPDLFDDDELAFFGDNEDDAILLRAIEERRKERGQARRPEDADEEPIQVNFEATLEAVVAHAQRVRAIPDHEQRREEAARVALALLDQ